MTVRSGKEGGATGVWVLPPASQYTGLPLHTLEDPAVQAVLTSEQRSLHGFSGGHSLLRCFPEKSPLARSWTLLPPSGERAPQPPVRNRFWEASPLQGFPTDPPWGYCVFGPGTVLSTGPEPSQL